MDDFWLGFLMGRLTASSDRESEDDDDDFGILTNAYYDCDDDCDGNCEW